LLLALFPCFYSSSTFSSSVLPQQLVMDFHSALESAPIFIIAFTFASIFSFIHHLHIEL